MYYYKGRPNPFTRTLPCQDQICTEAFPYFVDEAINCQSTKTYLKLLVIKSKNRKE